jgi:hypothetical protein
MERSDRVLASYWTAHLTEIVASGRDCSFVAHGPRVAANK